MDVRAAAEEIGLSVDSIYDLCKRGLLGHRRVGPHRGRIQILPEHIAAYFQKAEEGVGERPQKSRKGVTPRVLRGRPDGKPFRFAK